MLLPQTRNHLFVPKRNINAFDVYCLAALVLTSSDDRKRTQLYKHLRSTSSALRAAVDPDFQHLDAS